MPMTMYEMALAMNEAATSGIITSTNVKPMALPEDINEAIYFANATIMAEAVEMAEYDYTIDMYLSEAAMKSPETVMAITEASLAGLKDAIVKFFGKLKAAVMAIINRLKEFFAKLTGKTDKFVKLIEPRLSEAEKKNPNIGNTRINVHMWDFESVNKFAEAIDSIVSDNSKVGKYISASNRSIKFNHTLTKDQMGSDAVNTAVKELNDAVTAINEGHDEDVKAGIGVVANAVGVSGADNMEELWKNLEEKVTGGEKSDRAASDVGISSMVEYLKNCPKTIKEYQKAYDKYIKEVTKAQNEWTKNVDEAIKNFKSSGVINPGPGATSTHPDQYKNAAGSYASAYEKYMRALCNGVTKMYTLKNNLASGVQSRGVTYMREAAKEYMTALQKCAGNVKGKGNMDEE